MKQPGRHRVRIAIYGAGGAGAQLAQAMQISPDHSAVCFLDDRADLQRKIVAGLPVYPPSELPHAIVRHEVEQIVLAIPSASSSQKRRLIERVETAGLPVKILPGLFELVEGKASVGDIREVNVADLLGRDPVPPEPTLFARNIAGKVVLITGASRGIACRPAATARHAGRARAQGMFGDCLHPTNKTSRDHWRRMSLPTCRLCRSSRHKNSHGSLLAEQKALQEAPDES
jgi:hypothetical protein